VVGAVRGEAAELVTRVALEPLNCGERTVETLERRLIPAVRPSEQAAREGELLKMQVVNKAPEAVHESPV